MCNCINLITWNDREECRGAPCTRTTYECAIESESFLCDEDCPDYEPDNRSKYDEVI